ncbi:MAG: SpoIIE family protein phosphatase [Acidobacteriia bacterium]|nr:SpoIIE family protein phosphatase [Terriglobia bacterium]
MAPSGPSIRRLLAIAAVVYSAATILYGITWMYYIQRPAWAGIGIQYEYSVASRSIEVIRLTAGEGTGTERAGLQPGDRIVAVNGQPLRRITPYYDFVVRGQPGQSVTLKVERPGETTPKTIAVELAKPRPPEWLSSLTPATSLALEILRYFPLGFMLVGIAVLLLRMHDRAAWLLALFFGGVIASAPFPEGVFHPGLRLFMMSYHALLSTLEPALFFCFFALFPAPSRLDRRLPWLKWFFLVLSFGWMILTFWFVAEAGSTNLQWLMSYRPSGTLLRESVRYSGAAYSLAAMVLGVASLALNSFSAVTAEARRKARVIFWGVLAGVGPSILVALLAFALGRLQRVPFWIIVLAWLAWLLLPVSFAYAVVKHRVMEIPVLLRRSARYMLVQRGFAFLTVLWGVGCTGLFTSVGLSLSHFLPWQTQVTLPAVVVAGVSFGSLLALTGLRVHRRVTQRIDRAFFRSAYDARQILLDLAEEARHTTSRSELAALIEREVTNSLHPVTMAVYFETTAGLLSCETETGGMTATTLSAEQPGFAELARRGKPVDVPPGGRSAEFSPLNLLQPECLVPMMGVEGRLIGLLVLGPRLSEEPYSGEDKRLLASVASQAAIALENLRLAGQMAERLEAERRAAREMEIAKQVQARLLPQKSPPLSTLDYVGGCVQARDVGGDFYDFLDFGPGRVGLVLADISGKGFSGALLMANLQANLRSQYAVALEDPVRLFQSVNRLFCENTGDSSFATLFFADYTDASRRLRYVNCGHNPPFLIRADGRVERLGATATVLGLFADWECAVQEVELAPGDLLVLYTDGITEALSDEGEEFGEERLLDTFLAHRDRSVDDLLKTIVSTVELFSGREQEDDLTLVVARAR